MHSERWFGVVSLLYFFFLRGSQGCMCQPEHPQVLYCKSDFVVKALIQDKHDVLMYDDGSFDVIEDKTALESSETTDPDHDLPTDGQSEETGDTRPEPLVADGAGGSDEVNGNVPHSNDLSPTGEQSLRDELAGEDESVPGTELNAVINGQAADLQTTRLVSSEASGHAEATEQVVDTQPANAQQPEIASNGGQEISWRVTSRNHLKKLLRVDRDSSNRKKDEGMVVPPLRMLAAPAAYVSDYRGPDGAMPGAVEQFRGIRGKPLHLLADVGPPGSLTSRNKDASPAPIRQKRSTVMADNALPDGLKVPVGNPKYSSDNAKKGIRLTQYRVRILKDLKRNVLSTTTNILNTTFIYTPPSTPICRMDLTLKKSYVLLGNVVNSHLRLNRCDYKIDLKTLSLTEAKHLTSNMKHRFNKGCGFCQIDICNREGCESELPRTNTCVWKNMYSLFHSKASQFACVPKKSGECHWTNALNVTMVPEDLDN